MKVGTSAAFLAALCAAYSVEGDPEHRLERCFGKGMSKDPVELTSDAVRQYCMDVHRRALARRLARRDAQAACEEIKILPFTAQVGEQACHQLAVRFLDVNLWPQPKVFARDGFSFEFTCQSRTDCDTMHAYAGDAAYLRGVASDVSVPVSTTEPDRRYVRYAQRWESQQIAFEESSPGVWPVGKECLAHEPSRAEIVVKCGSKTGRIAWEPAPQVDFDAHLAGAERIVFACAYECDCGTKTCSLPPTMAIGLTDDTRYLNANAPSARAAFRVDSAPAGLSVAEVQQAAKARRQVEATIEECRRKTDRAPLEEGCLAQCTDQQICGAHLESCAVDAKRRGQCARVIKACEDDLGSGPRFRDCLAACTNAGVRAVCSR